MPIYMISVKLQQFPCATVFALYGCAFSDRSERPSYFISMLMAVLLAQLKEHWIFCRCVPGSPTGMFKGHGQQVR